MAMASEDDSRRQSIVTAITAELERQAKDGEARVNVDALAEAIDIALEPVPPTAEGKRPYELNATNDD
ncbi:MAG: hypothetical protein P0Y65_16850 [Candidatus Devosia phytovorans]|uniref:Uncharacterized protein n=1 Tax=Candidatus Devosia phytovorans TaxID=3121372 RepID=A0AAJ5VTE7_9HYPH|nr:hypothetical protein [Devosia sp.]WEK03841.1 MAG: hypothetical protein P0Y65_16850 [Devosia sp.]